MFSNMFSSLKSMFPSMFSFLKSMFSKLFKLENMLENMFAKCFQMVASGFENTPDDTAATQSPLTHRAFRKQSERGDCHTAPQRSVSNTAPHATKHSVATAMRIAAAEQLCFTYTTHAHHKQSIPSNLHMIDADLLDNTCRSYLHCMPKPCGQAAPGGRATSQQQGG